MISRYKKLGFVICLVMLCNNFTACTHTLKAAGGKAASVKSMSDADLKKFNNDLIDEVKALGTIKELSSEKYQGRLRGTEGNKLTEDYIASHFKQIGLTNPKGLTDYRQSFDVNVITLDSAPVLKLVDESGKEVKEYKYPSEYTFNYVSERVPSFDVTVPLSLLKHPNTTPYENIENKAVLLTNENREGSDGLIGLRYSASGNAACFVAESLVGTVKSPYKDLTVAPFYTSEQYGLQKDIPLISLNKAVIKDFEEAVTKNYRLKFSYKLKFEKDKKVNNIIGMIEGTDEKLKDQYIIIGSHFDHAGSNGNGTYNPGALDNASGTAAMMEIARIMKLNKISTKKTILFMAFNGEEEGCTGSEYYTQKPLYPLKNTIMINLDMVGSAAEKNISITGDKDLSYTICTSAKNLGIDYNTNNVGMSDHTKFNNAGAKAVMLINADLAHGYHNPGDTIDKVDKSNLEQIINLVLYYIEKED